ncbi:MAG: hypothetical protein HY790_05035 [Deltaproteobacteria bacterium]|nr:hypothetical protein [Deltaproteobacteria bacterium]MBI4795193.1 hypothetical protein [Deltaproteobacteria bacterium]
MPYIKAPLRQEIDALIDQLASGIIAQARQSEDPGAFAGLLNYACTRLALQIVRRQFGQMRYWLIALITGIFKNIGDEFYRRVAAAYEDKQMARSGDVDFFQEYLEEIKKM